MGDRMSDMIDGIAEASRRRNNPAGYMHERVLRQMRDFEASLGEDEEIGARLPASAFDEPFRLTAVGFSDPDLLVFRGEQEDGRPVELLQHHTQFNLLLVALPKAPERDQPRRIGFLAE